MTIDEVRKAGQPASSGNWRYWQTFDFHDFLCPAPNVETGPIPEDGWKHLPGCDCEYCGVDA